MKLRNRKSVVTNLPEGTAPVSRGARVTQWLYFLVLGGLLLYLGQFLLDRLLYLEARGQVEVAKTRIAPERAGVVGRLSVVEGQAVAAGDLLARLEPARECLPEPDPRLQRLGYDLALNRERLALIGQEVAAKERTRARLDLRRALEIDESRRREALTLERDLDALGREARLLEAEIALQQDALTTAAEGALPVDEACRPLPLHAPFPGRVVAVLAREHEYLERGQVALILAAADAPVRVEAYPAPDQVARWPVGREVTVVLPDGRSNRARVEAVPSAAYEFPERQWRDYQPAAAGPRVHLPPPDAAVARLWRGFDRLEVTVRQRR